MNICSFIDQSLIKIIKKLPIKKEIEFLTDKEEIEAYKKENPKEKEVCLIYVIDKSTKEI